MIFFGVREFFVRFLVFNVSRETFCCILLNWLTFSIVFTALKDCPESCSIFFALLQKSPHYPLRDFLTIFFGGVWQLCRQREANKQVISSAGVRVMIHRQTLASNC